MAGTRELRALLHSRDLLLVSSRLRHYNDLLGICTASKPEREALGLHLNSLSDGVRRAIKAAASAETLAECKAALDLPGSEANPARSPTLVPTLPSLNRGMLRLASFLARRA